jgi:hypothetical protein
MAERDIEADYKAAYIAEHALYARDGRKDDARIVAKILRDQFGYHVDGKETVAAGPLENTAAPKPRRRA